MRLHLSPSQLISIVLLATLDGRIVVRARANGIEPEATGRAAATALLDGAGGRALLDLDGAPTDAPLDRQSAGDR